MQELTDRDVAAGYPMPAAASRLDRSSRQHAAAVGGAHHALLSAVSQLAVSGRPVAVAFSGGRDSALVLAAAVRVARERGVADPVPITQVWPQHPSLDESRWQELVVRELALSDWQKVTMDDESELLGAPSREGLRCEGLVWPTSVHAKRRLWAAARGCHLLTGEGGDQVFGPTRARGLHHWRRGIRHPRAWARSLGPGGGSVALSSRARALARAQRPWLRPAFADEVARAQRRHAATEPIAASSGIRWVARDRAVLTGLAALDEHAARHGVSLHHPLLSPTFVAGLAHDAGLFGWPDRTRAMAAASAGLLPEAVVRRADKVEFSATVWGSATRSWLTHRWDGTSGVDDDLVDAGALRRVWAVRHPHPGTALLAQAAWLAQEGDGLGPR